MLNLRSDRPFSVVRRQQVGIVVKSPAIACDYELRDDGFMGDLALNVGTLRAEGRVGDTVEVTWQGECDLDAVGALETFFDELHSAATSTSPPRDVVFDLQAVEFMSSSCLSKVVSWLARIRDLEAGARYKVRIRSNPKIPWQKRSLRAVQFFAPELVTLEP